MQTDSILYNGTPGTGDTTVLTASGNNRVTQALVINTGETAVTATAQIVSAGGALNDSYSRLLTAGAVVPGASVAQLLNDRLLPVNGSLAMLAGDTLHATLSDGSSASVIVLGL